MNELAELAKINLDSMNQRDMQRLFAAILGYVPALISAINERGEVLFASQQHCLLDGVVDSTDAINWLDDLFPEQVRARFKSLLSALKKNQHQRWEFSLSHKDASLHLYAMHQLRIDDEEQDASIILTFGTDISDQKALEGVMREHLPQHVYMAFHDPVTGLANRSLFYDRAARSLARSKRNKTGLAVLLINIDTIEAVNKRHGKMSADSILKTVADRLYNDVRDTDTIARLAGSAFVILLDNIDSREDVELIATKITQHIGMAIPLQHEKVECQSSVGISFFPEHGRTIDELLRCADIAMSQIKSSDLHCRKFFDKSMYEGASNYLLLDNDLQHAIENNHFVVRYQPQIDLNNGNVVGVEALAYWDHRERGSLPPSYFIPLAEETGMIQELGELVLLQACEQFSYWLKSGHDFGKVAVNVSLLQFRQKDFVKSVERVLKITELDPRHLELEMTETSAMTEIGKSIDILNELKSLGVCIAIDDFGTGYSSLAYLKRLPLHLLKVDRGFIEDVDNNPDDQAIVKSIIDLSHNMGLKVIAEGVERKSQLDWLEENLCDYVQGFYFSPPLQEKDLIRLYAD